MERVDTTRLCLDSSIIIGFLRGRPLELNTFRTAMQSYKCCVASITVYEVLFGAERKQHGTSLDEETLLGLMSVLSIDDACARRASKLHASLVKLNADISIKDVLIAVACLDAAVPLLTTNARHFRRVSGLQVVEPSDIGH